MIRSGGPAGTKAPGGGRHPKILLLLALTLISGALLSVAPAATADVSPAVTLEDAYQRGSQIIVEMNEAWMKTGGPSVTPAITNYEYSTDGGTTWRPFDPPTVTPTWNSLAGYPAGVGFCSTSNGAPFAPGTTYDVRLRAVNADGPGEASAPIAVPFREFTFYEMNPCGGNWGGQDLKIMTGGVDGDGFSYFNTFGIIRGGQPQVFAGVTRPGHYCFYMFAQATAVGCTNVTYLTPAVGVAHRDWDDVGDPVFSHTGNTWTIDQTARVTLEGKSYSLTTTLSYTSPMGVIDVHHVLETPDVSDLQRQPSASGASGSSVITVNDASGIVKGMCVSAPGIPANAVVKDISGLDVTLDRDTTSTVSGTATFTACAKIYQGADMFLDGSDFGPGDASVIGGERLVVQATDPAEINPSAGVDGGVGGIMEVTGYPFTSYVEAFFYCVFGGEDDVAPFTECPGTPWGVSYGGSWPNTVDTTPTQDAGTAAEWSVNPSGDSGRHEVKTRIFFASGSPTISGGFDGSAASAGVPVNLVLNLNNAPMWQWEGASFEMLLPSGATAGEPTTTCANGTVRVDSGRIVFGGATLTSNALSCSISVPMTFSQSGVYAVSASDVSDAQITNSVNRLVQELVGSFSSTVNVEAAPAPTLFLNKGTRKASGTHDRIRTTGSTTGIPKGTKLTPHIRYTGQTSFAEGKGTITVRADGTFSWSRLIRKDRGITAYVSYLDVDSNRVSWGKIR